MMNGRKVFLIFLGFFLVIILVNAVFAFFALKTHKGVVTDNAHEKGLHYGETTSTDEPTEPEFVIKDNEFVWDGTTLQWRLRNDEGAGIAHAKIQAEITQGDQVVSVPLTANGKGVYQASPTLSAGTWNVSATAMVRINQQDKSFTASTSLTVEPQDE